MNSPLRGLSRDQETLNLEAVVTIKSPKLTGPTEEGILFVLQRVYEILPEIVLGDEDSYPAGLYYDPAKDIITYYYEPTKEDGAKYPYLYNVEQIWVCMLGVSSSGRGN